MKKTIKLISIFTFAFMMLLSTIPATTIKAQTNKPYKLLVYYGMPSGVNGLWDDDKAAQVFANYDYIVLGDGLEHPTSEVYASTINIISKVHKLNQKSVIFGYVDLGVSTTNLPIDTMKTYYDQWKTVGADGILLDDAGYDYLTPRARLNTMLDYIHSKNMYSIVNAWNADDVMGSSVDSIYNPTGSASHMGNNDFYLLESYLIAFDDYAATQGYAPPAQFKEHLDKALKYRKQLGVKLLSLNAVPFYKLSDAEIKQLFKISEAAAVIGSLDGYSLTPVNYSGGWTDGGVVKVMDYMPNYFDYYKADAQDQLSSDSNIFTKSGFTLDLTPGKQSYSQQTVPTNVPTTPIPNIPTTSKPTTTNLAANNITQTTVGLTWNPVPNVDFYNIYQNDILVYKGIKDTKYKVKKLNKNTYTNFTVTSSTYGKESDKSNMVELTTLADIPSKLKAVADSPWTVKLSWNPVPDVYAYNVYRNGKKLMDGLVDPNFIDSDLIPNTSYTYTVTTINAGGETAQSQPVTTKTKKQ